ncbi:MAG: alpha/beta fold hydrolase [Bacteroidia bacterium]
MSKKLNAEILFAHANGFPGGSYQPLFDAMAPHKVHAIASISEDIADVRPRLRPLADILEARIRRDFDKPIIGMGHSLGGVLMYLVAKRDPALFSQLILMDPPFFRPSKRLLVGTVGKVGLGNIVPVARLAAKRRSRFSSHKAAEAYFSDKKFFQRTHPDTVRHYVAHGLVEEGDGFRLRIPPEFERAIYLNLPVFLGKKVVDVPSTFLYATRHDVLSKRDVQWLKRYFSQTTFIPMEGSHMFPLEQPEAVANAVLAKVVGS